MKTKTIKSVLLKKFNEWIESIKDEKVKELVENNTIITGGCIPSMLLNEKPNDFDVYFRNKETTKAVAQYYVNQWNKTHGKVKNKSGNLEELYVVDGEDVKAWKEGKKKLQEIASNHKYNITYEDYKKSSELNISHMITNTTEDRIKVIYPSDGVVSEETELTTDEMLESLDDASEIDENVLEKLSEDETKEKYRPIFLTTNAISLSNKIQIVIRFYGNPNEIHANYDFAHCCCYWDSKTRELETPKDALLAILNKDLIYKGSKYPICSMIRSRKFIRRGWKINAGQYVKMAFQVSELDLKNVDVLEDQLVGIDTVYFLQIVRILREKQEKDTNFQFDGTYLSTIIDRIF